MKIHVKYYMMYERFENGGKTMNTIECMKTRRSIRKFKPDPVNHATLESVIEAASYSPYWKNTQITRYTAIEDSSVLDKIVTDYTPDFNAKIIKQATAQKPTIIPHSSQIIPKTKSVSEAGTYFNLPAPPPTPSKAPEAIAIIVLVC